MQGRFKSGSVVVGWVLFAPTPHIVTHVHRTLFSAAPSISGLEALRSNHTPTYNASPLEA